MREATKMWVALKVINGTNTECIGGAFCETSISRLCQKIANKNKMQKSAFDKHWFGNEGGIRLDIWYEQVDVVDSVLDAMVSDEV
jgi:hypothetical protein